MKVRSLIIFILLVSLVGCDAFVRKFTRKPKKENIPHEELVLVPEEYNGPGMTKEELYRQYFLFWKSWHGELVESLSQNKSQKKKLDCLKETVKNLINLRALLIEDKQKKLDGYLAQLQELEGQIRNDLYGNNTANSVNFAERIKRNILKDFSYNKIKNSLL